MTLLADVTVQDPRKIWLATGSLLSLFEDAISGSRIAPSLLALAVVCLPLCLQQGDGPVHSHLALPWYSLNLLFCEWAGLHLKLELFWESSLSLSLSHPSTFLSLWVSHSLGFYLTLAPSDCPQGIQAQSLL